jgi:hypothetical protein
VERRKVEEGTVDQVRGKRNRKGRNWKGDRRRGTGKGKGKGKGEGEREGKEERERKVKGRKEKRKIEDEGNVKWVK